MLAVLAIVALLGCLGCHVVSSGKMEIKMHKNIPDAPAADSLLLQSLSILPRPSLALIGCRGSVVGTGSLCWLSLVVVAIHQEIWESQI